jgi:cytochrome c biogenesis protein
MKANIFRLLINLKFAIFLLLVLALFSALGSIIEQDQSVEYYQENYPTKNPLFGFFSYHWILNLQLNHLYTSWLFLFLIFLLALSLVLCSFKQQLPLLEISRRYIFLEKSHDFNEENSLRKSAYSKEGSILFFTKKNFYLHQQKNNLYGFKGILGKIGPLFVHFSLICILVGAVSGSFGRFQAQEFLPKGEIVHIQNILSTAWFSYFPKITIRLNDFWIEYKNQKIHQFYSDISLLDNLGNEIKNKVISVNNPMEYCQMKFYQMDWGLLGIRMENSNKETYQYPLNLISKSPKIWVSAILSPDKSDMKNTVFLFVDELRQNLQLYDNLGNFVENYKVGDRFIYQGNNYRIVDLIPETGIQIKYDPSVFLTYLGFGSLLFSTFLSYLTYSQIWLFWKKEKIFFNSETTRAKSSFEIECKKFLTLIDSYQDQKLLIY